MNDTIYRQAALDAFGLSEKTRKYGGDHSGYDTRMLYEIQDVLEGLPSAQPARKNDQPESAKEYCAECDHIEMCGWYPYEGCEFRSIPKPERKKGKWEYTTHYGDRYRVCPFCKVERRDDLSTGWYFCPNCGEAME